MRISLQISVVVAMLAVFVCSCESKKSTDGSKVPLDVKEAEAKDPTRLDSARTDVTSNWTKEKAATDSGAE